METFHVYVVGAEDRTSEGLARVAEAIAAHYGLPADDLLSRLTRGRFRVKTGVDRTTADQYHRDLIKLGARVAIETASPTDRPSGSSLPPPARPQLPPPTRNTSPPVPAARPAPPSSALGPPRPSTPPPAGSLQSGLSAAFSNSNAAADLSAFDNLASGVVASLDGVADEPPPPPTTTGFGPPGSAPPAKPGVPAKPGAPAKPPRPRDTPVDMDFAPPDAAEAEMKMEIATDELEHRARRRAPAVQAVNTTTTPSTRAPTAPPSAPLPPPSQPTSAPLAPPPKRSSQPAMSSGSSATTVSTPRSRLGPLGDERIRMAAGVLVAILVGFIPAHFIASAWESSAYRTIDAKLDHDYDAAEESADAYALLDNVRDHELEAKRSARNNIALVCMFAWATVGVGIGYVWFRRVPWDDLDT